MSDEEIDALFGDMLPHWAIGKCNGQLVVGASLPTRDGRRTGNAVVAQIIAKDMKDYYKVVTDMGNIMTLTDREVEELFYEPVYICHERDILKRIATWPHD